MSSAETAKTDSNISFHRDRHSCTVNNRFIQLDGSLGQLYPLESPKALKQNQFDISNFTACTGQRPPRKRQKVLRSQPFRLESYQPNNLQSFEVLSREQAISYESPTTQSTQKIQAEWPKRGRTNARGRASISTQYNSPLRSQSYIDCDTMDDRHPSRHPPRLSPSTHRNRSVSPAKGTQSRSVSPKKEKQNRSVSPTKGKEALRKDGMKTPSLIEHRFPEHFKEGYLHLLREMRDGFIPLGLKKTITKDYDNDASFHHRDVFNEIDRSQSSGLYYGSFLEDDETERMTRDFHTLIAIQKKADDCDKKNEDEEEWCQCVVRPLLSSALHKPRSSTWNVKSVQSKKINPSFAVREAFSESEDDLAEKKIDYVIFLDPDSKETKELYEAYKALNQRGWKGSQGLWKHLSTADLIPLFIFEVKVAHLEEGEFQLMTAARAFLKYLQSLIDCSASDQKASLLKRLPPVIGWVVHKHEWKAYMSHSTDDDGWVWIPLSSGDGKTSSKGEAVRLLRIIETFKADFGQKYMAWLKEVLTSKEAEG